MDIDSFKNINDLPNISQTIKEYNLSAKKKNLVKTLSLI